MKLIALGFVMLAVSVVPAQKESLHMNAGSERANISFTADNIERQDPPQPSAGPASGSYASIIHVRGNVVIRACCVSKGLDLNGPIHAMFIHAYDAEYHPDSGEIEIRGNAKVTFEDYPIQVSPAPQATPGRP